MEAYTKSKSVTGRSTTRCGYCRQTGHSIRECPHIEYDAKEWAAFRVPVNGTAVKHNRWLLNDYSYWVKQVNKYYPKWKAAQEVSPTTGKRVSAPRKCGFCRGEGHTRRDCSEMKKMYQDILAANRNYRQALYDTLVTKLGLGVGAVVRVQRESGYFSNRNLTEHLVTVEDFNIDSANFLLATQNYNIERQYTGKIQIKLLGKEGSTTLKVNAMIDDQGRLLAEGERGYWNTDQFIETVAPSTKPLPSDWVDRDADAFAWFLKKRSKEWIEERSIDKYIQRWK